MKNHLKTLIDQFVESCDLYKSVTKWDSPMMDKLCALQSVCSKTEPNTESYKQWREYIKINSGFFSSLKGEILPVLAWQLSTEKEPELLFDRLLNCKKHLKEAGFSDGNYLVISALHIVKAKEESEYAAVASKMKMVFNAMKRLHPLATSQDDYIVAAMLAVTGINVAEYSQRISRMEELLKNWMKGGNELQSVSNLILLFNVDDIALCERAITLHKNFKEKGYNFNSQNMTALLALLVASKRPADAVTTEIIEAADYLKTKKGFGSFSLDKRQRAMLMTGLFLFEELGDEEASSISNVAIQSMVVDYLLTLQTMCICCCVTAAAVASSSASQ